MPGFISAISADLDAGVGAVVFLNGQGDAYSPCLYARQLVRAALGGAAPPEAPAVPDPLVIENAAEYEGRYAGARGAFTVRADGNGLFLHRPGESLPMERRRPDAFFVPHPDFALFLLRFGREGEAVVEATHGPDWYRNERYAGEETFDTPSEWAAYRGHYRCFSPWISNVRIFPRKGRLFLHLPQFFEDVPLTPRADGSFAIEADMAPLTIRFGPIVDGEAISLDLSGGALYRVNTP
jgi:hypothetical protein